VRLPGALGVAAGAIAIGMVATSKLTTIIISIATIISTATSAAPDKVIGSTIPSTEATRRMGTGKRRINSEVRALVALAAPEIAQPVELEIVRVVNPALAIVQEAEPEPEIAQVAAEPEIVPVAAELEHDRVAAEPARDPRRAQLVVLPKTKSVIAALRRALVAVIAVEDLAAVAETTRDPAAPEAVIVWGVAVTAVAAVGIAVAVE
jgi:hypothetical protein